MITLRPSQQTAFKAIAPLSHIILNAPTGWGKSMMICALAGADLLSDPTRKVVICIPQQVIAKGFINNVRIALPGGRVLDWSVSHNLCDQSLEKVKALKKWLTTPAGDSLSDRVVVTTHVGLTAAFGKMTPSQTAEAIANTTFVIDEAHHIYASDDGFNCLGAVVNYLIDSELPSTKLIFATAFFFRGDNLPILGKHIERFHKYSIPFDEHWSSMRYLKSYKYDFVCYKGSVWKPLERLLEISQEPTLFYCPPEGHRLLLGKGKARFTKRVRNLLKQYNPEAVVWKPGKLPEGNPVILDLVDQNNRAEKIKFAMTHGDKLTAILTVGMFREGADWQQAQRVIDLIPSGSDQDRNQRFGRLIRDFPGKTSVSYYSFFPQLTNGKSDEQRKDLSTLFAHFHASLILENALSPIKIPKASDGEPNENEQRGRPVDLFGVYDEQTQENILYDACESLIGLAAEAEEQGLTVKSDDARRAVIGVLKSYGVKEDRESLAKQIVLMLRRKANLNLQVRDLLEVGFDKIWADDALEGIRLFSAGFGGPKTFREIRKAILSVFEARWTEMFDKLKELPTAPAANGRAWWWIQNNKSFHRDGRLSPERVALLETIPWWEWEKSFQTRWIQIYEEIAELKSQPLYGGRGKAGYLYQWITKQRMNRRAGNLTTKQLAALDAIPWWHWETDRWEEFYQKAQALQRRPYSTKKGSELPLYNWMHQQRLSKKKGKLSTDRQRILEDLSWWKW